MPFYGIIVQLTHTGQARASLPLSDVNDGIDALNSFRKAGPVYVPVDGTVALVYAGDVAISFEIGAIRKYLDAGHLTATFVLGTTFLAALPGGGGASHDLLLAPSLVWTASAHVGTANRIPIFDGTGAAAYITLAAGGDLSGNLPNPTVTDLTITGEVQGSILYFNGTNWVQLAPGVSGQFLKTNGAGANPAWAAGGGGGSGDVTGPGASTDNAVVRWDGATGTVVQNSTVILDDLGNLTGIVNLTASGTVTVSTGALLLPLAPAPSQTAEGSVVWDTNDDLLTVGTGTGFKTLVDLDNAQTLSSKTLVTPTIASFVNATHNHQNAAGGGQLDHGTALTAASLLDDDHPGYALLAGNAARNAIVGSFDFGGSGELLLPRTAVPVQTSEGSVVWDTNDDILTVGTGTGRISVIANNTAAGGDLSGSYPNPTVTDLTITGEVQGSVLYFNGTNWVRLAPGTAGQFLRTNGAGANPTWAAGGGGGGGGGDVFGPGASTDNALVRWDGASGTLIQDSNAILSDAGGLTIASGQTLAVDDIAESTASNGVVVNTVRNYGKLAADPGAPAPTDGDIYYNTALRMQMVYDGLRSKWLSVESSDFHFGRNGNVPADTFFRGADGRVMSDTIGWYAVRSGTVVSLGYTRSDSGAATFEIVANGVSIGTVASAATGGRDITLDAGFTFGDVLAVRNQAGGNAMSDVIAYLRVKWSV